MSKRIDTGLVVYYHEELFFKSLFDFFVYKAIDAANSYGFGGQPDIDILTAEQIYIILHPEMDKVQIRTYMYGLVSQACHDPDEIDWHRKIPL